MNTDVTYHFPPDLFELLVDALPLLVKGKGALLDVFRGVGMPRDLLDDVEHQIITNRDGIKKHEIARTLLQRLNNGGDREKFIRARRQLLRRVIEWEDFNTCYSENALKAQGAVAAIQRRVNAHDSFIRMANAREAELEAHRQAREAEALAIRQKSEERSMLSSEFGATAALQNGPERGRAVETVLNKIFNHFGISVREPFRVRCDETGKVLEQIDGAIEIDAKLCLAEIKWWSAPVGVPELQQHISRILLRGGSGAVHGIYIACNGYSDTTVKTARDAIAAGCVIALCDMQDFVAILDGQVELREFLRTRVNAAILDKNPYLRTGSVR